MEDAPNHPPPDLGHLPMLLGHALRRAQAAVLHEAQAGMAELDIRPAQHAVMQVLHRNPGLRQSQVSQALGIQRTNFVPLFDALERRGLVERRDVAGDRRAKGLFLTDAGTALLARLDRIQAEYEARLTARIGPDGKQTLLGLLARLSDPAFGPG
ncbi:MAG: hypothetical protein BGP12_04810 [Rhodospirillales bacterium 70-18]|nr:MarR family transcriptional regulator [Rhodospirillales bacterium]OJY65047.1 MAG: hypothetical protein BGP12_04810 [Rhodospirillales bacterium 70-18]